MWHGPGVMRSAAGSSDMVPNTLLDLASSQVHGILGPSIVSNGDGTLMWESCALNKVSA